MQVKKFEAPTMQEALKVIKKELGPEAIILSTKHIKSGFGLMSKASVEVTAAITEKNLKKKQMAEKNLPENVKEKIWNSKAEKQAEIYNDYFDKQLRKASKDRVEISTMKRENAKNASTPKQEVSATPAQRNNLNTSIGKATIPTTSRITAKNEILSSQPQIIRDEAPMVESAKVRERRYIDITDDENSSFSATHSKAVAKEEISGKKAQALEKDIEELKSIIVELASSNSKRDEVDSSGELSSDLTKVLHDLVAAGVEKKYARQLIRNVAFDLSQGATEQEILDKIALQLIEEIKVRDLLDGVGARAGKSTSTIISLVGPTGVGKTTTIAKIASLGILEKRLRVGLINLDSYKVAAADQLATYAKIMNVPFRSVNSKDELLQAIYDFSSLDLVLIDTTGRSQKDQESLLQLRHMLAAIVGVQNVLLVSATTKDTDMNEVVSRFKLFNPAGIVFSKLDETSVYGCIYNVQKKTELPLLYFTVGQRVPEDIEKASAERVVDLVLDL